MHAGRRTLHKPQRKEDRGFAKKKVLIFRQIAVCFLKNIVFVGRTGQRSLFVISNIVFMNLSR